MGTILYIDTPKMLCNTFNSCRAAGGTLAASKVSISQDKRGRRREVRKQMREGEGDQGERVEIVME